ncbi:MAG: thioredoxin [Pseudobdellovibrionaceae bacterium]|jgi:thioredoxin 1
MGQSTVAVNEATFEAEVLKSQVPVLVDFWAEWCGPCRAIAPKLEEIGSEMGSRVKIAKVDVDNNQEIAGQFGIRSIPTMILFKGGKAVDQIMGNVPKENLVQFIEKHL